MYVFNCNIWSSWGNLLTKNSVPYGTLFLVVSQQADIALISLCFLREKPAILILNRFGLFVNMPFWFIL